MTSYLYALVLMVAAVIAPAAYAQDRMIVDVPLGGTVDVYFEINLEGEVYLKIEDSTGPTCVDLWWIRWPLGNIKDIGEKCGFARLEIPGWTDFAFAAKLRARGRNAPTKIGLSARENVARSITFEF